MLEGVRSDVPFEAVSFNLHRAGIVRIHLVPEVDIPRLTERLSDLPHVTGVLHR
jgi:hypothetical protein